MKNLLFTALIFITFAVNAQNVVTKTLEGTYKKENEKSEIRFSGNKFYLLIPTAMAKYIYEGSYSYNTSSITLNIEKYTAVKMSMKLKQTLVFNYVLNEYTLDISPGQNGMASPFKWAEGRYYKYQDGKPPANYAELLGQAKIETKQAKQGQDGRNRQNVLIVGKITPQIEDKEYNEVEIEKGFPVTFTSDGKTYTIDKCKIIQTDGLIFIEIFGEGVGKEWINDKGDLAVLCTYFNKGAQYNLPVIGVEQNSIAYTAIGLGRKILFPDNLMFYPSNNGKIGKGIKVRIER